MPEEEVVDEEPETAGDGGSAEGQTLDDRLVVEGLLFSAGKPLRIADIEKATTLDRGAVRSALKRLASDYRRRNTSLEVVKVGNRWTMQVATEYTKPVRAVTAPEVPSRLLRTLALIAYHQPVLQADIQEMLGPKVYDHVRELVGLGPINATRKGATKQLTTTQRFPEYFGITSAKRDDIKRFLADRVGIEPPEPHSGAGEGTQAADDDTEEVGSPEAVGDGDETPLDDVPTPGDQ